MWYILNEDNEMVPAELDEAMDFFSNSPRRFVGKTDVTDEVSVSTVFLCFDHGINGARPLVFETMVFGGILDAYQRRYRTYDGAKVGHAEIVRMVELYELGDKK